MENIKKVTTRKKGKMNVYSSTKRQKEWNGKLTASFLVHASNAVLSSNNERGIPIIYAKNGVIYKESRFVKTPLGKITGLKRQIKEKNYTIEYIKISE